MGWKSKTVLAFLCFVSFATGIWPLGLICIVALVLAFRRRGGQTAQKHEKNHAGLSPLYLLAGILFALAVAAAASGGTYSPLVLFAAGSVALALPSLGGRWGPGELHAVERSIALRSKYFPFLWCALAELKPGAEAFPRAVASFSGNVFLFTDSGKCYVLAKCIALYHARAESELLRVLKETASDRRNRAHLLPLDSSEATGILGTILSPSKLPEDLGTHASDHSGLLVIDASAGRVVRARAYTVREGSAKPSLPSLGGEKTSEVLLWEVLDSVGKRTRWPEPDSYSGLLESLKATRGEAIGERFAQLEGSGPNVTVRSLGGESLTLTRSQLRAIVSIYS